MGVVSRLLDELAEFGKERVGIMRPGRCLRMVLDAEDGLFGVAHPFDGLIIQVNAIHLQIAWQRFWINGKAVILRSDFDFAALQILHRLIRSAMAKLQLECLASQCEAENLMPEANAKNRQIAL